ncbi:hypothetical protein GCM10010869_13510 [Mesorhizobium tianshanense]|nr:hypothetical protein GCM10010869_13510 [Mesorhizobium tianshanense]
MRRSTCSTISKGILSVPQRKPGMLKIAQSASASLGRTDRSCGWIFSEDGEVVLVMALPAKLSARHDAPDVT